MVDGTGPAFVGRTGELAQLLEMLRRAESGRPAMALVAGEAGVGKTRLLAELAARASADGARVLVGGCLQVGDVGLPYVPFIDASRDLGSRPDEAELIAPRWSPPCRASAGCCRRSGKRAWSRRLRATASSRSSSWTACSRCSTGSRSGRRSCW